MKESRGDMKELNWKQKQFAHLPDPRVGSVMVCKTKKRALMLFGGVGGPSGRLNDTWVLEKDDWKKNADTADLPPRSNMGFAYDDEQDILLLFGGHGNSGLLGDTWVFDGNAWKQQQTEIAPSPRGGAKLAFDTQRRQTVLFGGASLDGRFVTPLGDTWLWDGFAWQQKSIDVSPAPRSGSGMVYDASRQVALLFGGQSDDRLLNDTWVWDGATWNAIQPAHSPSPRANAAIVYNPASQQVILFGGQTAKGVVNDTWVWDGLDWSEIEAASRPPLDVGYAPQMCYAPAQDNVLLLAGRVEKTITPSGEVSAKTWSETWVLE
jgi:hypothetical protein